MAQALDLVGERWALLVIRELMFVPKRFSELKTDLPGIATNMLSQRLTDLEQAGIVVRRLMPGAGRAWAYDLTDWGRESLPVLQVISQWAVRSPLVDDDLPRSIDAVIVGLQSHFQPQCAGDLSLVMALTLSGRAFTLTLADRILDVTAGAPDAADIWIEGDRMAVLRAMRDGGHEGLTLGGDRSLLPQVAACFAWPQSLTPDTSEHATVMGETRPDADTRPVLGAGPDALHVDTAAASGLDPDDGRADVAIRPDVESGPEVSRIP